MESAADGDVVQLNVEVDDEDDDALIPSAPHSSSTADMWTRKSSPASESTLPPPINDKTPGRHHQQQLVTADNYVADVAFGQLSSVDGSGTAAAVESPSAASGTRFVAQQTNQCFGGIAICESLPRSI